MAQRRSDQVNPRLTPYYHCYSRCVRRAYLCGNDPVTGKNFDHRKQWLVERIKLLSSAFAIDICAYAVMSNHFHIVTHISNRSAKWSMQEVIERWTRIYHSNSLVDRYIEGKQLTKGERKRLRAWASVRRKRLSSLSWFMRALNENLARRSNKEDECTGRFWEGRFGSTALLDQAALLMCMAYVDLNPVRAGICDTPESSDYTSIQQRLYSYAQGSSRNKSKAVQGANRKIVGSDWLMPLCQHGQAPGKDVIPVTETSFFELVDWTGRIVKRDKPGVIPRHIKPTLERLNIDEANWTANVKHLGVRFHRAIGNPSRLREFARHTGQTRVRGERACRKIYLAAV